MNKIPIDELNNLTNKITEIVGDSPSSEEQQKEIIDTVEKLLIMAFVFGTDSAAEDLGIESNVDENKIGAIIYEKIEGKTWEERITDYLRLGNKASEIVRVIDTETMRVYNEAKYLTAEDSGLAVMKTWVTVGDDRVRDSHWILEGVTIPLNDKFYTLDGDSALRPYGFEKADNNINCRCALEFSKKHR